MDNMSCEPLGNSWLLFERSLNGVKDDIAWTLNIAFDCLICAQCSSRSSMHWGLLIWVMLKHAFTVYCISEAADCNCKSNNLIHHKSLFLLYLIFIFIQVIPCISFESENKHQLCKLNIWKCSVCECVFAYMWAFKGLSYWNHKSHPTAPLSKWAMLTGSVGEECLQPGYSQKHQWSFDCDVTAWLIMKVQSPLTHSQA